ncbi:MAG: hypothetical protein FJX71_03550 [Alphaproteobacteria bacterium]|nr:hypothetical protein [Alphaproteobacteria bacterium]
MIKKFIYKVIFSLILGSLAIDAAEDIILEGSDSYESVLNLFSFQKEDEPDKRSEDKMFDTDHFRCVPKDLKPEAVQMAIQKLQEHPGTKVFLTKERIWQLNVSKIKPRRALGAFKKLNRYKDAGITPAIEIRFYPYIHLEKDKITFHYLIEPTKLADKGVYFAEESARWKIFMYILHFETTISQPVLGKLLPQNVS